MLGRFPVFHGDAQVQLRQVKIGADWSFAFFKQFSVRIDQFFVFINVTIVDVVTNAKNPFLNVNVRHQMNLFAVSQCKRHFDYEWSRVERLHWLFKVVTILYLLASFGERRAKILKHMHQVLIQVIEFFFRLVKVELHLVTKLHSPVAIQFLDLGEIIFSETASKS